MKNLKDFLEKKSVWAFNINDLLEVKAISKSAELQNKPAIMLISSNAINFAGLDYLDEITKVAKETVNTPLFVQLDHGKDEELIIECARRRFDVIMVDSSFMDYENNVEHVRKLAAKIKKINNDILVEAELGIIGDNDKSSQTTEAGQVKPFISETKIDLLAVSVGNNHGFLRPKPVLDRKLLKRIFKQSGVPLVLHGGDWVNEEDIKFAVQNGFRKINIGPELRLIVGETIKSFSNSDEYDVTDHRKIINKVIENLTDVISRKLQLF